MTVHYIEQSNPCVEAACVGCGTWDPDDPTNDCPAWGALRGDQP